MSDAVNCKICHKDLNDPSTVVKVFQKGADGVNTAAKKRGDDMIIKAGDKECRRMYTNPQKISADQKNIAHISASPKKRSPRLATGSFNNLTDCLFCGTLVPHGSTGISFVKTDEFVKSILECCQTRSDEWA